MRLSRKLDSVRGVSGDRHSYRDYREKSLREYACSRNRHKVMTKTNPKEAGRLMQMAQETVDCCGLDYATPVDTGVEGGHAGRLGFSRFLSRIRACAQRTECRNRTAYSSCRRRRVAPGAWDHRALVRASV